MDGANLLARPVRADHPESRPGTAHATGHVGQVEDDETLVVRVLACDADTVAAIRTVVGGIDTNAHSVRSADETSILGCTLIDKVDCGYR